MDALKICAIIAVCLLGLGTFAVLLSYSIIEYKTHKKKSKLLEFLSNYYEFYYPSIGRKTVGSVQLADDIYYITGKRYSHSECEELSKLLTAIGYYKHDSYDPTKGLF